MLNFRVFDTHADLAAAAAEEVVWIIEHAPGAAIALSGGSTPRPLYELLGGSYRERLAGRAVTWVMGDERMVPSDHPDSNSRMVEESLFRSGIPERHRFLKFDTTVEDPAAKFEQEWRALGLRQVDVAILGVGNDGHTASLFPGTAILNVTDRIAAHVDVPQMKATRLSLTLPTLRDAQRKLVLATGEAKREVIERIGRGESFPMTEVVSGGGETWWFVDRAAWPGSGTRG